MFLYSFHFYGLAYKSIFGSLGEAPKMHFAATHLGFYGKNRNLSIYGLTEGKS